MRIVDRGAKVLIQGDDPDAAVVGKMLAEMLVAVRNGHTPTVSDVPFALSEARDNAPKGLSNVYGTAQSRGLRSEIAIKPRTRGQAQYLDAIKSHGVTMVIGPAGTGKTYLAMAAAVSALLNKEVNRLILTRPAVEAGESLGFLPGDLQQKVNPYLRPLYDALYAMVDVERARKMVEREVIEVAPLAFMRGRTLNNAFAILDEAQNTTPEQMKMFLTRLGEGSRAVVTGDVTQHTEGIAIVHLHRNDVVRHPLVQNIIDAYEAAEHRVALGETQS